VNDLSGLDIIHELQAARVAADALDQRAFDRAGCRWGYDWRRRLSLADLIPISESSTQLIAQLNGG
jgi:hypothetical protein